MEDKYGKKIEAGDTLQVVEGALVFNSVIVFEKDGVLMIEDNLTLEEFMEESEYSVSIKRY